MAVSSSDDHDIGIRRDGKIPHRFSDIFDRSYLPSVWRRFPIEEMEWLPAIDVYEKEEKFVVKADLPGMKEEDIDVSVVGDIFTIKGEKKSESEVKEENYHRSERTYGSFLRSISLSATVDAKNIEANYADGVL